MISTPSMASTPAAVRVSGFSVDVLDAMASASDWTLAETIGTAVDHYLDDRIPRAPGWRCLPLPERRLEAAATERAVVVKLSNATLAEIRDHAAAQHVSPEALVVHAVMYLWAADGAVGEAPSRFRAVKGDA